MLREIETKGARGSLLFLPGRGDLLRCLSYFVRLRRVDTLLHPLRQLLQILLGCRKTLAGFLPTLAAFTPSRAS